MRQYFVIIETEYRLKLNAKTEAQANNKAWKLLAKILFENKEKYKQIATAACKGSADIIWLRKRKRRGS